jgi:RNA-directed DNA polymerase
VGGRVSELPTYSLTHSLATRHAVLQELAPKVIIESHPQAQIIRYADDLVVLHEDSQTIEKCKQTVSKWLAGIGLELKPSKTRITHTLNEYEGSVGFDFLGFYVRQYRVGKTHSGKTNGRYPKLLGYKTIIKPSSDALKRHLLAIKSVTNAQKSTPQAQIIGQLNPIIKGWTAYYATVVSSDVFSKMAHLTYVNLHNWARRRHPNKPWKWIAPKYWRLEQGKWEFAPKDGVYLHRHFETPIKRHIKVRGNKSPYDGDWVYWAKRTGRQPGLPKRITTLIKRQNGKCVSCGLYLKPEDKLEVDHLIPKSKGGKDGYNNLQLLHAHCHHKKSAKEANN